MVTLFLSSVCCWKLTEFDGVVLCSLRNVMDKAGSIRHERVSVPRHGVHAGRRAV